MFLGWIAPGYHLAYSRSTNICWCPLGTFNRGPARFIAWSSWIPVVYYRRKFQPTCQLEPAGAADFPSIFKIALGQIACDLVLY